jgi:hypothetical protein
MWIQTRRAEDLLDAVRRDEILGIFVAQDFRSIADADGACPIIQPAYVIASLHQRG